MIFFNFTSTLRSNGINNGYNLVRYLPFEYETVETSGGEDDAYHSPL